MKRLLKSYTAAALAMSTGLAPLATQLSTAVATRASLAAVTSAAVLLAPSAAHAQSGKRICGTVWGLRASGKSGYAAIAMEVSKYDVVTCTGLVAAWVGLTSLPTGLMGTAQALFNNTAGVGYGLIGSLRMMQTCESFSGSIQANTGNVCLKMTDYKLYKFVKVSGGAFSMGRL